MAAYTILNGAPALLDAFRIFQPNPVRGNSAASSVTYTNADGTKVVISGVGLAFDASGVPVAGVVSSVVFYDPAQVTPYAQFTGVSANLLDLYNAWVVNGGGIAAYGALLGANNTFVGSANNDTLMGSAGADTIDAGAGNDYIEPGRGADAVDGGTGFDTVSYQRDIQSGGTQGVNVNLSLGLAKDGFGMVDTLKGIEGVTGTEQGDVLRGGDAVIADSYTLTGLGGNDVLLAGAASAFINPGAGNDVILGGAGFDQVNYAEYAGSRGAVFNYAAGVIADPYGNVDSVGGVEGAWMTGNADIFVGDAADNHIEGLAGNDYIDGGAGTDFARYDRDASLGGTSGIYVDLQAGFARDGFGDTDTLVSIEGVRGTNSAYPGMPALSDVMLGSVANNVFRGFGGNDYIDGRGGQDRVEYQQDAANGGPAGVYVNLATGQAKDGFGASDMLVSIEAARGTDQADVMMGGDTPLVNNSYEFYAQAGDDLITAGNFDIYAEPGAGNDRVIGGAGTDQVSYAEYTGSNGAVFNYAAGFIKDPYGGTDTVSRVESARMTRNADSFTGDAEDDVIRGLGGADYIDGGAGTDQVRYDRDAQYGGTAGVYVDLQAGFARDGFGAADMLVSIEDIRGTNQLAPNQTYFGDTLLGSAADNNLQGLGGNDVLDGRGGIDRVDYSQDAQYGGAAGVHVDLAAGFALDGFGATDSLFNIENIRGTNQADTLKGDAGDNDLQGLGGADMLDGGAGSNTANYSRDAFEGGSAGIYADLANGFVRDGFGSQDTLVSIQNIVGTDSAQPGVPGIGDIILGSSGANTLDGRGGNDIIRAGGGDDTLLGGAGNDILDGEAGNDRLVGGAGNDTLTGGAGNDLFVIDTAALVGGDVDMVTDFLPGADSIVAPLATQGHLLITASGGGAAISFDTGGGLYTMLLGGATVAQVNGAITYA